MSEMSAAVVLKLDDQLSGPAKRVQAMLRGIFKDVEKLNKLSGRASGAKQFDSLTKGAKQATAAAHQLRQTLARPMGANFTRPAVTSINRVTRSANQAVGAIGRMNAAMRRSSGLGSAGRGGGGRAYGGGGHWSVGNTVKHAFVASGVYEAVHRGIHYTAESIKGGFEQAFGIQHTKAMLTMQGENQNLIEEAHTKAAEMAKSMPQFTTAQNLEAIAELRPALLGGLKEATNLAPMFQHAISVLEAVKQGAGAKALGGVNTHGEALSLVRALEVKNVTGLGEQAMQNYVDGITKAIVAFNGQIKAEDFHSAFKFSRGDSVNWSPEFATEILPTLMNELKKSSKTDASMTGNALKSMSRVVMDGVMGKDTMAKWDKLGMFKPSAVTNGKGGPKKNPNFLGGAMVGSEVWQSNPYQWVQDYLLPHLKEHGVDLGSRAKVVEALGGLFGNRVANHIAQILSTQQAIIKKDQENVRAAQGTNGLDFLMGADPTTRMHVLSSSFKELGSSIAELAVPGVMRGMKGVVDWAHQTTDWIRNAPEAKRWGQHFEALTAGFFQQDPKADVHSRHWMSRGPDLQFYNLGTEVRKWITGFRGQLKQQFDSLGITEAGAAVKGFAADLQAVRDAVRAFSQANAAIETFSKKLDVAVLNTLKASLIGLQKAFAATTRWFKDKFSWVFPEEKADPVVKPNGPHTTGLREEAAKRRANEFVPTVSPYDPTKNMPFGLSGFKPQMPDVITPITSAANAAAPTFTGTGQSMMTSLASGMAAGASAATGQMSTLMASLASIAAAGVTVPVKLDTAAAEGQLSALMARASKVGGGGKPQFTPALNDVGH